MVNLKKTFSSFVAMVTVLSSVGVGSLGFASAASAVSVGDLIKASGPAVYYYAQDGKRYVFPNEKTYFSWYTDFASVKTISDAELAAITIGGNVTVRPGTKLIKIQTDPKTYAVTRCGSIHWIESETIAKSLYGDAWATRIIDVPDAFFVNYTVGSSVSTAVHPDGQVITYEGDANSYIVMGGMKRKFASQAAFDANMLNAIYTVGTTISYADGTDVTGREADIADVVCAGPAITGDLTVALASDTPAGATLPKAASSVQLAKYMFTAGASTVTVNGLTIHRVGVGAASDWANVYLYDQDGLRLTTGRTINSSAHTATFSGLTVAVPAGGSAAIYLYGDVSSAAASAGQHSFEIPDAASVVVNGSVAIGGMFPVRGNVFTIGTSSSGRLDVLKGATPANPVVGAIGAEISNFKLTANTNDIRVNAITLYQAGSVTNSDISNLKLYQGTTLVATASGVTNSGRIVLKFEPTYLITAGTTKVFSLKADVAGRSARTIKTYVEYTTDVNATDTVYNAGAAVCIAATAVGGCSSTTQGSFDGLTTNYIEVTTQGGTLTNAFNGPSTGNVAKGQLAVPLYKFSLTAENGVEIRNVRFSIAKSAGTLCYVRGTGTGTALDGTMYFRNIKIKNLDTGTTWMGPTEMSSTLADQSTDSGTITLSDTQNILAGQTLNLAVVADLSNSEDATGEFYGSSDCGYKVTLQAFTASDVRIIETGEFLDVTKIVPNSTVIGNQQNIRASNLTVSLAGSPSSGTLVKKQSNVPVAGIVLSAGAQSDVLITNLTLTCQAKLASTGVAFNSAAALADCNERYSSLSLWDGATQVGTAKAPDTTTGAAQITNLNLNIPAGTSKSLTVAANLSSTASTTAPYDQLSVGIASTNDITAQDGDSNTVTPTLAAALTANANGASPSVVQTILNSGTVTYNTDANPASTIVVAGKDVWVPFASYKATAQYEAVEIDRLAILASSTAGLSSDNAVYTSIAVASGGAVKASGILSSGAIGTKDIDLSASKLVIPKDGTVSFQLWAKLSSVQASSTVTGATTGVHRSGSSPALGLKSGLMTGEWDASYYLSANIHALGQASGEVLYASTTNATHGNAMVTRKTKPTVTKQSLSSTILANADMDLIKFQVAADSAGTVGLKQVVFSLSKTSALTLANFRVRKGASDMALADVAITYSSTTEKNVETGTIDAIEAGGYIVVSFTNEEQISGSGNVYTLHATVGGAASGQNMSLSFYRDANAPVVTGYLDNSFAVSPLVSSASIFTIDVSAAPSSTPAGTFYAGTFLWSDMSEVPHSSALGTSGGSRDWTNDVYVEDVSQTQSLSL
ncbi:hypothetical protein KJ781_02510 [Patescibacteria group bacterium]|nr:hypothetical protein [Patescibacteria group bacterium]MBU2613032.1 hypothetical protein [Patescibacteria group bacterium]